MELLSIFVLLVISYIIGALPFGLLVVKIATGKDVRLIGSGRTGGTNVMRAAGIWAGAVTAILDFLKGGAGIILASWFMPGQVWVQIAAGLLAVLASIRSIFLRQTDQAGKTHLRGGAGGAAVFGAITAFWIQAPLILLPLCILIYYFMGYASITTISIAVMGTVALIFRAAGGYLPWEPVVFGFLSIGMVIYALLPNLKRLREGTEREVGLRAFLTKQKQAREKASTVPHRSQKPLTPTKPFQTANPSSGKG